MYSENARYSEVVLTNVTLSPDCKLLAESNINGLSELVEVINVPRSWELDDVPDWSSEKVTSSWFERNLYYTINFNFEYRAETKELALLITVDSYTSYSSDIFDEVALSDGTYIYNYQKKVLDFFDFCQSPGYGSGCAYGRGQGSIGWYGGGYYVAN